MPVTRSKLFSLQDLLGDDILTRPHFVFSEKYLRDFFFFRNDVILRTFVISPSSHVQYCRTVTER